MVTDSNSRRAVTRAIAVTAEHYGFSWQEIIAKPRQKSISHARCVAMYVARKTTTCSYTELGIMFERDHTTVISAVKQIARLVFDDQELEREVKAIIAKLTGAGPQARDCSGLVYDGAGCTEVRA